MEIAAESEDILYLYMYNCVYIYMYINISLSLPLSPYIHIYAHTYIYIYTRYILYIELLGWPDLSTFCDIAPCAPASCG